MGIGVYVVYVKNFKKIYDVFYDVFKHANPVTNLYTSLHPTPLNKT